MSKNTTIQWCDSTVNPTMGCDGCELWDQKRKSCYAGILHMRFGGATKGYAPSFEEVTLFPGRMAEAARLGYGAVIVPAGSPVAPGGRVHRAVDVVETLARLGFGIDRVKEIAA